MANIGCRSTQLRIPYTKFGESRIDENIEVKANSVSNCYVENTKLADDENDERMKFSSPVIEKLDEMKIDLTCHLPTRILNLEKEDDLEPKLDSKDNLLDRGDLQGGTLRSNTPRKGVSRKKMTPKKGLKVSPKVKASTPEFQKILRRIKEKRKARDLEAGDKGGADLKKHEIKQKEAPGVKKNENVMKLRNIFEKKGDRMPNAKRPPEFKSKSHTPKRGGGQKKGQ